MPSEMLDAWIVVPAFNEAGVIGDVITALRSVFTNVVCVDDGSADGTGDLALRAGAHLVSHPVNLGQGAAIQTGVEYARSQPGAQVFATFDADGQHRVQDVVTMIDRLGSGDVDIVIGTRFGAGVSRPPLLKRLVLQTAVRLSPRILEAPARLDPVRRELDEYFAGRRTRFDVAIDWALYSDFGRRVLQATAAIPFGRTATYGEVAAQAGNPKASRAAGRALGANAIPIVIPCHRVVGAGGKLTGYTGGLHRKEALLRLEGLAL